MVPDDLLPVAVIRSPECLPECHGSGWLKLVWICNTELIGTINAVTGLTIGRLGILGECLAFACLQSLGGIQ
jgi:hypothetical protein